MKRVAAAFYLHEDVVAVDDRNLKMREEVAAARELFVVDERIVDVVGEDRHRRLAGDRRRSGMLRIAAPLLPLGVGGEGGERENECNENPAHLA